jgi:hypothetical protein
VADDQKRPASRAFGGAKASPPRHQAKVTVAEQHLLELILHDDELRDKVLPLLEETDYEMLATAPVYNALYALKKPPTVESLLDLTGDDEFFSRPRAASDDG